MERNDTSVESPATILAGLAESLSGTADVDSALAEILSAHILTVSPSQDAVAQAKNAIVKLAADRATPPKIEGGNG